MPSRRRSSRRRRFGMDDDQEDWKLHNTYDYGSASSRMLTRSQAAFIRIKNTDSDFQLFADVQKYQPPSSDLPHLMVTMKGKWGSVPNTTITRHSGKDIPVSEELCNEVDKYKRNRGSKSKESLVVKRMGRKRSRSRKKQSSSRRTPSKSSSKPSRSGRKRSGSSRKRSSSRRKR